MPVGVYKREKRHREALRKSALKRWRAGWQFTDEQKARIGATNRRIILAKLEKEDTKALFLSKIEKNENGCWLWQGLKDGGGYGVFRRRGHKRAHRYSYATFNGDIPKGMFVCHSCDVPACANPKHLWLGTPKDNMQDCIKKGRDNHDNSPKGEDSPRSKLKMVQVLKVRELGKRGISQRKIAERFRCTQTTIHYILSGKTWKHV